MKHVITPLLLLFFLLTGCVSLPPVRTVSVTVGTFEYNEDIINVAIEKRASKMGEAESECDKVFDSIKKLIERNNLDESSYNMSENSTFLNQESKSDVKEYIARKSFDICVTDDMDPDSLMEGLRDAGATGVHRNIFARTVKQKVPTDIESVLNIAENRAKTIAETAGYKLGKIINIDEITAGIDDSKIYKIEFQLK